MKIKMIKQVCFVVCCIHFSASAQQIQKSNNSTSDKKIHIFLLMGQSNMVGRDTTGLGTQKTNDTILYLDKNNEWKVAIEPMHVGGSGIGPGISFANKMLQTYSSNTIGLVPCAVGGSPLRRWEKGGDLYIKALAKANEAAKYGIIDGILWHQGETDSEKKEDADTYKQRLSQMLTDFRSDLGKPKLPVVIGELGDFIRAPFVNTVRTAIIETSKSLKNIALVKSNDLVDKGDHLHFTAKSQDEFGKRYAVEMKRLLVNKSSKN